MNCGFRKYTYESSQHGGCSTHDLQTQGCRHLGSRNVMASNSAVFPSPYIADSYNKLAKVDFATSTSLTDRGNSEHVGQPSTPQCKSERTYLSVVRMAPPNAAERLKNFQRKCVAPLAEAVGALRRRDTKVRNRKGNGFLIQPWQHQSKYMKIYYINFTKQFAYGCSVGYIHVKPP